MTELLYLRDSYLKQFTATVTATTPGGVILDKTAFYPRGGGQPNDTRTLTAEAQQFKVTDVRKTNEGVVHTLSPLETPQTGSEVTGAINWSLRYTYMRMHSALHVLCGVTYQLYRAQITGSQISADRSRMDLTLEDLSPERVATIEAEANRIVAANLPIRVKFLPREAALKIPDLVRTKVNLLPPDITNIRVVEIEGLDQQADGGTHVKTTREIGGIKIVKTENKGKNNKRIEIQLQHSINP